MSSDHLYHVKGDTRITLNQARQRLAVPSQSQAIIHRLGRKRVNRRTQDSNATETLARSSIAHKHLVAFGCHLCQLCPLDKNIKSRSRLTLMEKEGITLNTTLMSSLEHDLQAGHMHFPEGRTLGKKLGVINSSHHKI